MNRKKLIGAVLFCSLFGLSACGNLTPGEAPLPSASPTSASQSMMEEYQNVGAWDDGYLFAVGYLGYYTEESALAAANTYAEENGLETPDVLLCDGMEGYVVIPKYPDTKITVNKYLDEEKKEKDLVAESEKAVILFCNPSDLYSNVEVTVQHGSDAVAFSPYLNLQDGTLALPKEARDITVSHQGITGEAVKEKMTGDWRALAQTENGTGYYDMTIAGDKTVVIENWMSDSESGEPKLISRCTGQWDISEDAAVLTCSVDGKTFESEYTVQVEQGDQLMLLLTWVGGERNFSLAEIGDQIVFTQQI